MIKHTLAALLAALSFTAGTANALTSIPQDGSSSTLLAVFDTKGTDDTSDDIGYLRELFSPAGTAVTTNYFMTAATVAAIQPTASVPMSFTADANMTSFLTQISGAANVYWNVVSADSGGDRRLASTVGEPVTTINNATLDNAAGRTNTYFGFGIPTTAAAPSLIVTAAAQIYPGAPTIWGTNFASQAFVNSATLGQAMDFRFWNTNGSTASSNAGTAAVELFAASPMSFTLAQNGNLIYAPVPEPESYALMLAGLAMVGAIARRRRV